MEIELRFFATFRQEVGQKTIHWELGDDVIRAGDVLQRIEAEYPGMDLFEDDGSIQEYITVLKNGRDISHVDGLDTGLEDGDSLSIFPPVAGG